MSGGEHVELWTLGAFPSVAVGVVVLRSGEAGGAAFANAVSNRACQGTSGPVCGLGGARETRPRGETPLLTETSRQPFISSQWE